MTGATADLPSLERSVPLDRALAAMGAIRHLFHRERNVSLDRVEMVVPGRHCVVARDASGEIVTSGFGKGAHVEIGAFGECVEHFHLAEAAGRGHSPAIAVSPGELATDDIFIRAGDRLNAARAQVRAVPHRVLGGESVAYVPATMFGLRSISDEGRAPPHELFYSRYSSSNGSAFGLCLQDALLHALLEIVERHEISLLFIDLLQQSPPSQTYDLVEDFSFCPEAQQIAARLAADAGAPGSLVKKTEFGAFFAFSFVAVRKGGSAKAVWGAGCSMSRDLAIYRSLAECEQSMGIDLPKLDDRIAEMAARWPAFANVERLRIEALSFNRASYRRSAPVESGPAGQLAALHAGIAATGRRVCYFEHAALDPSYSVVTAFVPNTEKFFGIIFANPVLPMAVLQAWLADS